MEDCSIWTVRCFQRRGHLYRSRWWFGIFFASLTFFLPLTWVSISYLPTLISYVYFAGRFLLLFHPTHMKPERGRRWPGDCRVGSAYDPNPSSIKERRISVASQLGCEADDAVISQAQLCTPLNFRQVRVSITSGCRCQIMDSGYGFTIWSSI